jgi:hypothetical protein
VFVCLFVCLFVQLFVCLFVCLFVSLPALGRHNCGLVAITISCEYGGFLFRIGRAGLWKTIAQTANTYFRLILPQKKSIAWNA